MEGKEKDIPQTKQSLQDFSKVYVIFENNILITILYA